MKKTLSVIAFLLVMALCLTACGNKQEAAEEFTYGKGIDDNGYWKGITALDHVKLASTSDLMITPAEINEQIGYFKQLYPAEVPVYEGIAETGDTVNIDFIGYIDGEAFENGSSNGAGYPVTLGEGSMIPGFEDGIIGHSVGENFELTATFPEYYGVEELNGKEATFDVTLNYIVDYQDPEITDAFVMSNLSVDYGWLTVDDMNNGIKSMVTINKLMEGSEISDVPQSMIDYQTEAMVDYYKQYAAVYGLEFDQFLLNYVGVADEAALREQSVDYCTDQAEYYLFIQALAEQFGIVPTEDDVKTYYDKYYGGDSTMTYDDFTGEFGMPYLKSIVLPTLVQEKLVELVK